MPDARQAAAAKSLRKRVVARPHRRRLAQQAGDHHAVHQGHAGPHLVCAFEQRARLLELRLAARPRRRSRWRAHWPRRSPRRSASRPRPAARRSRRAGRSGAPTRRRAAGPTVKRSPEAARPSTTISQASSDRPAATSATVRRFSRAPWKTMVSCGSQSSDGALAHASRRRPWRSARPTWRRGRSSRPPGSPPRASAPGPTSIAIFRVSPSVTPPEVVTSTACGGSPGSGSGNNTRQGSR